MEYENLAVACRAGADADRRDRDALCDEGGNFGRDALEDERETSGILEQQRLVDETLPLGCAFPLDLETAECVDALRCEPDVAHDGNLRVEDRFNRAEP